MTYDDYGHINADPKVAALTHQIGPKSVITFPSGGQKLPGKGFYESRSTRQREAADFIEASAGQLLSAGRKGDHGLLSVLVRERGHFRIRIDVAVVVVSHVVPI